MNKAELIETIAGKTGLDKKHVEMTLDAFEEVTIVTLQGGGEVTLTGFGTFSARQRKGRIGVNPQNPSEKIEVKPVTVPKFKAGKNLKEALKKNKVAVEPTPEPVMPEPTPSEPVTTEPAM